MRDVEIINENLRRNLAAFSHARDTGLVRAQPAVSLVSAGVPFGLFNTALLTAPLPGEYGVFSDVLTTAREFFRERGEPWSMWFCEDLLAPAERRVSRLLLATAGMRLMMDTPGMIASHLLRPRRRLPVLDCRRVGEEATRLDFARIMSAAFSVPSETAVKVYGPASLWEGPFTGWVGYHGGEPVTSACTVVSSDAIGLYAVGTLPPHQRKGYGEAIVRHAIYRAQMDHPAGRIVLQSSLAGHSLYAAMGFRDVTRFCVYV